MTSPSHAAEHLGQLPGAVANRLDQSGGDDALEALGDVPHARDIPETCGSCERLVLMRWYLRGRKGCMRRCGITIYKK